MTERHETPGPGLYEGIPDEQYFAWDAFNASTAKKIDKTTCLDAYKELLKPREPTAAMQKGTALHLACLMPNEFDERIAEGLGIDRRSNDNKAKHAEHAVKHEGKIILPAKDYDWCLKAAEAMQQNAMAMSVLNMAGVKKELCIIWLDRGTGIKCKAKLDLLGRWQGSINVIADVKSTDCDMSDDELEKAVGRFGYEIQASSYLGGVNALSESEREFWFIWVNSKNPSAIRVTNLDEWALKEGEHKYRKAITAWAKCQETGVYKGWPQKLTTLSLKPWDQVIEKDFDAEEGS